MAPIPDSRCDAGRGTRAASTRARAHYKYPLSTLWIFETRPPGPPTHWGVPSGTFFLGASRYRFRFPRTHNSSLTPAKVALKS